MANVRVLPSTSFAPAAQRIASELAVALESGADLGPRGPHIRKQLTVLHYMVQTLQLQSEAIAASPEFHGLKQELLAVAEQVTELVASLTKAAGNMLPKAQHLG